MKLSHLLAATGLVAAAFTAPAHATVVLFTGVVSAAQGATGETVGNTVSGEFTIDPITSAITAFEIDGKVVAPGFSSTAAIVPSGADAIYQAQLSPVSTLGAINSTFALDLSSLSAWPTTDTALSLLTDAAQLSGNLDIVTDPLSLFPSTFDYYIADASGNVIASLTANLTTVAVPEPASLTLLLGSLIGFGAARRRRG